MRISFDLDDTLICYQPEVPRERCHAPFLLRWWLNEPLRLGARELLRDLQKQGYEVWVYTTSFRSPLLVRLWLRCYGLKIGRVLNQAHYDAYLRRNPESYPPSKNPRVFGIDLHIDDSEGLRLEGKQHGFDVLVIDLADKHWAERIRDAIAQR